MPTDWFYPSTVTQYPEVDIHIPWTNVDDDFTQMNLVRSSKDLRHISNPMTNDVRSKTYFLKVTGFNFSSLPNTIQGIEAQVSLRRGGRITDETVALCVDGQALGDNKALGNLNGYGYLTILDDMTYGGQNDLWGTELTSQMLDDNFGLVLRFQTHPYFCHVTTPLMNHVQLRVW